MGTPLNRRTRQRLRSAADTQPRQRDGKFARRPLPKVPKHSLDNRSVFGKIADKLADQSRERLDVEPPLFQRLRRILTNPNPVRSPKRAEDPCRVPVDVGDTELAGRAIVRLSKQAQMLGIVVEGGICEDGSLGVFCPPDNGNANATIRLDKRQNTLSALSTLAHELGHAFDPWTRQVPKEHWESIRPSSEVVAQLVSREVCRKLGVDNRLRTAAYVNNWTKNTKNGGQENEQIIERAEYALKQVMAMLQPQKKTLPFIPSTK